MSEARPRPGAHAARHRGPNALERARHRSRTSVAAFAGRGGKAVGLTIGVGALATAAVVGTQAAMSSPYDAASASPGGSSTSSDHASTSTVTEDRGEEQSVSRSSERPSLEDAKRKAMAKADASAAKAAEGIVTDKAEVDYSDPRGIARDMIADFGWSSDQFSCLDSLWVGESNWRVDADNPTSSAYGIPQALPGSKMASAGDDWATNPATQIKWGLGYIKSTYGTPCSAEDFKQSHNWY